MANVNIRIDDSLKRATEGVLSELGLSLSAATTLFYKQVVRYGGIPLDLRIDRPNEATKAAIAGAQDIYAIPVADRNSKSKAGHISVAEFSGLKIDTRGFKFNREEANERR